VKIKQCIIALNANNFLLSCKAIKKSKTPVTMSDSQSIVLMRSILSPGRFQRKYLFFISSAVNEMLVGEMKKITNATMHWQEMHCRIINGLNFILKKY
jgi:hypothetical protein